MLLVFHFILCVLLVTIVLLQAGKSGGFSPSFAGSSQSLFGSTGAGNFLTRLTTTIAVLFFVTSLVLTIMTTREGTRSVVEDESVQTQTVFPTPAKKDSADGEKPKTQTKPAAAKSIPKGISTPKQKEE